MKGHESLVSLRTPIERERAEQAARVERLRAENAQRTRRAHEAAMAAEWRPALTAEQLRDVMARARWDRARARFKESAWPAAAQQ